MQKKYRIKYLRKNVYLLIGDDEVKLCVEDYDWKWHSKNYFEYAYPDIEAAMEDYRRIFSYGEKLYGERG